MPGNAPKHIQFLRADVAGNPNGGFVMSISYRHMAYAEQKSSLIDYAFFHAMIIKTSLNDPGHQDR